MFYSKRINKLLFILCILATCSIHQLAANPKENASQAAPQLSAEETTQLQQSIDALWTSLSKQAKKLDEYCEDIALLIRNNVLQAKDKDKVIKALSELRSLLYKIYERSSVAITIDDIYGTELILKGLIEHINRVLEKKNFNAFKSFDIAGALRYKPATDDFIFTAIDDNIDKLEKLHKQVANAGISWYNKAYRVFNRFVLQPTIKYDIHKWVAAGAIVGGIGWFAYSLWHSYASIQTNPSANNASTVTPEISTPTPSTIAADADNTSKPIPSSQKIASLFLNAHAVAEVCQITGLTAIASGLLLPQGKKIAHALSQGAEAIHCKLMGGIFAAKGARKDDLDNALKDPRYTFADVIGNESTKDVLSRIKFYLEDPERFDSANIRIPKGYLFGGPSRSGKTFMAEALAGEIMAHLRKAGKNPDNFKFMSVTNIEVTFYGIEAILAKAKKQAPCLLFIDEIDLLGLQRTTNQQQLSEFLTAMSGCMENNLEKQVIIIAATNRPENIEEALCKPGRFGKYVQFTRPTYAEKKAFIKHKLEGFAIDSSHFDVDSIVRESGEDAVFAALDDIINTALLDAKRQGVPLTQKMLESALDEEIHHIVPADKCNFPLEEKKLIAAHFAGHVLASMLLDGSNKLTKVTINPIAEKPREEAKEAQFRQGDLFKKYKEYGQTGKVFYYREGNGLHADGAPELRCQCEDCLAGYAAEKILLGHTAYGYPHYQDGEHAFNIAIQLSANGLANIVWDKDFPEEMKKPYVAAAIKLQSECTLEIEALLTQHKQLLQTIADALLEKATLSRTQIIEIIRAVEPELAAKIAPSVTATQESSTESVVDSVTTATAA